MAQLKNTTINDPGFLQLPTGTTAQRPASPQSGYLRYNTTSSDLEVFNSSSWIGIKRFYDFTSFTFTTGGIDGRTGPSLATLLSSYNTSANPWLNDTNLFNVSSGIQQWTVPVSGWYTIEAWGAAGGDGSGPSNGTSRAGYGAKMRADFYLTKGTVYNILVGQEAQPPSGESGGGGGGTFVYGEGTLSPLIVAGGGGGSGDNDNTGADNGVEGNTGTSGTATSNGDRAGASNGQGAAGGTAGGGGAGFLTNGGNGTDTEARGGVALINGGAGGDGVNDGGFGGGGAESRTGDGEGAGGAGGYSGGAGGDSSGDAGGGGGGSYISFYGLNAATSNGSFSTTGDELHPTYSGTVDNIGSYNNGPGRVVITRLGS
jgi:hypothetical protein